MTDLEKQVIKLLEVTGTTNVLDAIDYIKTIEKLITTTHPPKDYCKHCKGVCTRKDATIYDED